MSGVDKWHIEIVVNDIVLKIDNDKLDNFYEYVDNIAIHQANIQLVENKTKTKK